MIESRHQRYRRLNPKAYAESQARYRSSERYQFIQPLLSWRRRYLYSIGNRVMRDIARGFEAWELMAEYGITHEELLKITIRYQ